MSQETNGSDARDERLNLILAEYLQFEQTGEPPDREQLLRQHPDFADELRAFFADHDKMQALAEPVRASHTPDPSSQSTEATLITSDDSDAAVDEPNLRFQTQDHVTGSPAIPPPDTNVAFDHLGEQSTPRQSTIIRYFGGYEVLEEIARGGMGVVYKARQTSLNRIVALKMILAGKLASTDDVNRFQVEAEAAANLDHPGIVPIFEIGEHGGLHYFSMGFVQGQSLADRVNDGPLPPREAAEIMRNVAKAVSYAHGKGVIHRDLKPANVLLDAKGEPKVSDFGLAKQVESDSNLTRTGTLIGTPNYMPPEQARCETGDVGPRSDVYSLGAVLYCLLVGHPPFQSANPMDVLSQVLDREPISLRQLNPAIDRDLETIAFKCLTKDPTGRYSSAEEFADDLQRFLHGEPINARPISTLERLFKATKRQPKLAVSAGLLGMLISTLMQVIAAVPALWNLLGASLSSAMMFLVIESVVGCFGGIYSAIILNQKDRLRWTVWITSMIIMLGGPLFIFFRITIVLIAGP